MVDDLQQERIDREANALVEERIQNAFEGLPEAESLENVTLGSELTGDPV